MTPAASTLSGSYYVNIQQKRFFSKGEDIDVGKFTHETRVIFPDVSDDDAGFDGEWAQLFRRLYCFAAWR